MLTQRETDHAAPFATVLYETSGERILRVASIGKARLTDWYSRFGGYTHPATYGDSGCDFAASVAYRLKNPDLRTIDHWSGYDYDIARAVELLND